MLRRCTPRFQTLRAPYASNKNTPQPGGEPSWLTTGQTSLLPPRWKHESMDSMLLPKFHDSENFYSKISDRTYQPQLQWVDTTPARHARAAWEARDIEWTVKEKPLIDLAFDKPEAVPLFLKDLSVRGYEGVWTTDMMDRASFWIQESRYWRCIGIYYPFYHNYRLRAHFWRQDYVGVDFKREQIVGSPYFSPPMLDALVDLEHAYIRKEKGLAPNYRWAKWSPVGNNDGSMNDWLPRMPTLRHEPDPDSVPPVLWSHLEEFTKAPANEQNVNAVHDAIKKKYAEFIYSDSTAYDAAFSFASSAGKLSPRDFPFQDFPPNMDLRDAAYVTAHARLEGVADVASLMRDEAALKSLLIGLRTQESDEKVEAVRLFYSCSNDIAWVRSYIEEKCGLADFMQTTDKEITLILKHLFAQMRNILTKPWGKAVAEAATSYEYRAAVGDIAYEVAMMIQDASIRRAQERFQEKFKGEGKEEKVLDFVLSKMGQRVDAPQDTANYGSQFDREKEPVGRQTQRRVLQSDRQGSKGSFWEKRKKQKDDITFDPETVSYSNK